MVKRFRYGKKFNTLPTLDTANFERTASSRWRSHRSLPACAGNYVSLGLLTLLHTALKGQRVSWLFGPAF